MDKQEFYFSKITDEYTSDLVDTTNIENALIGHINLSDYGSGFSSIAFTYIMVKEDNEIHENKVNYDPSTKNLDIQLKLKYQSKVDDSKILILEQMARLFVQAIDLYPKLKIVDFDEKRFRNDVMALFEEKYYWFSKERK